MAQGKLTVMQDLADHGLSASMSASAALQAPCEQCSLPDCGTSNCHKTFLDSNAGFRKLRGHVCGLQQ